MTLVAAVIGLLDLWALVVIWMFSHGAFKNGQTVHPWLWFGVLPLACVLLSYCGRRSWVASRRLETLRS